MLLAENISKKFSGVTALDNVSLELHAGKVNAIIGENGAGKSTLMKILSGVYTDYEGKIMLKGKQLRFTNPKDAQDNGIVIIHQELNLIPYLTVTENVFLGRELTNGWGTLDTKSMRAKTHQLLDKLKLKIDPDTPLYKLKVGQQQVVEIAKALLTDSHVIIMDEPTSAISENEVEVLFDIIEDLKKEGKIIVYISHKLDELFRIADRYIVLRDGKTISSGEMKGMSHDSLINKMVGRSINLMRENKSVSGGETLLSVEHLCLKHAVRRGENTLNDISFSVCRGEIVGIFGLMGAGRTELLETIFGLHPARSTGRITIGDKEVHCKKPADAIKAGLALVPENRKKDGLVSALNVKDNICITTLSKLEKFYVLDNDQEGALAKRYIDGLAIKTSSHKQAVKNLSGGNQQKIVLAKWLATKPTVLMLDEPTRGVDVNAKSEIYKLIFRLAEEGLGIIVVSSELPEILAIADRILVMVEGTIPVEFLAKDATEDNVLMAAIPQH